MLIDFVQNKDSFQLSYVNSDNKIDIVNVPLLHGYYQYVVTDEDDKQKLDVKSFKNNLPLRREPAKYFTGHNINEFINNDIKMYHKEIHDKISLLNIPVPISVDIETKITDKYGYSSQHLTQNPILSISITDTSNMETLIFELKNTGECDVDNMKITDIDNLQIKNHINQLLGKNITEQHEFNFKRKVFETEQEMLNVFLECINKYFHSIVGWNFLTYDWVYIVNRCRLLGINVKKCSPTHKLFDKKIRDKRSKTETSIKMPYHRIIGDYMVMFKQSLTYNNLGSYSLENCSQIVLNVGKVQFEGNLRTLFENDYNKFIAYAIIDTILVALLHAETKLYNIDFFEAYYNKIAYMKISQNAISEALIYNELREANIFLPKSEYNSYPKQWYPGGFVKTPTKKINRASLGLDYSGLYPNSMITMGLSPDTKIDKIDVDKFGYPKTKEDLDIWNSYKEQDFILVPTGRIYAKHIESGEEGLYVRIEKKLIAERKIYKNFVNDIYINIVPRLEKHLKSFNK